MKVKKLVRIFLSLTLLCLFGCAAGKQQYDVGMQLYQAGKLVEAMNYLNHSLQKEPGNKEYKRALDEVKEKLVNKHVAEASKELSAQSPVTIAAINNAKAKLAGAKSVNPKHPSITSMEKRINRENDALLSNAKGLYLRAKGDMESGQWLKAYFNLQQIQSVFPNYEDTFVLMSETLNKGSKSYFDQAKTLYDKDDFKGAKDYLRKALSLKSDHKPARELLQAAEKNDNMDYFVQKATKAVSGKDWDGAVKAYERALEYEPQNQDLQDIINHVRSKSSEYYIRKAREQIDAGWLTRAFENYKLAEQYADAKNFRLGGLRRDLTSRASFAAEYFKDNEQWGAAWYWYNKIYGVEPNFPEMFKLIQSMEDKIKNRTKKSIAVFDFSSPADNRDAGIIFASNLITFLFKNASGDIKIMERQKLRSILEEMKLGQMGVVSEQSAKEMGRVYGIDVAIMGSVLLYKVDSFSANNTKTIRYQIGTKIEDNIEYLNWKAKNPDPSEKEMRNSPPAKITVPQYAEKVYTVSNHKKVGFVELSFHIVDVTTGENIQVKTVERKKTVEDETSAGLADAGIKYDPLEIPTDTELLQKMTDEVVAELGSEVLKPLRNLERIYFKTGESLLRRRNELEAAESFSNAIIDEKMKMIQGSPLTKEAMIKMDRIFREYKMGI